MMSIASDGNLSQSLLYVMTWSFLLRDTGECTLAHCIYLSRRDRRLSWLWWLVICRVGSPVCRQSHIQVVATS